MTTALDIVRDAAEEIGYKGAETALEDADAQLGLRKLNDMLAEWDGSGIKLGASPVASLSDTVRVPRWALLSVKLNLAGRLTAPFSKPMTADLAASIKASTDSMLRALVKPINVSFPGTLPTGSGNECSDFDDDRFFPQNETTNF